MGRHAKPHNPKEQEPQEDRGPDEQGPSTGRHAKDRQCRPSGEPSESWSAA
ncbi:hypothetical protein [Nonomuraea gerenzanensis]|uniref:Uncharacterized protein n=1 Tax=Nonomuraea gerenzanensis TaxID=93944 RepID=A0A1M4ELP0_9ACTN|nr:hypothetical protein [Nonomuraea gerenzanensis]UBU11028.1 hypothetical protein LCN96_42960 [Nonomuraea gerenzanensis]SBO99483.1 hypothetical protein BN4615_P8999 [Nonomuraea gerenzanensis]